MTLSRIKFIIIKFIYTNGTKIVRTPTNKYDLAKLRNYIVMA